MSKKQYKDALMTHRVRILSEYKDKESGKQMYNLQMPR